MWEEIVDLNVPNLSCFSNVTSSLLLTPTDAFAFRVFGNPVSLKYFPQSVKTILALYLQTVKNLICDVRLDFVDRSLLTDSVNIIPVRNKWFSAFEKVCVNLSMLLLVWISLGDPAVNEIWKRCLAKLMQVGSPSSEALESPGFKCK